MANYLHLLAKGGLVILVVISIAILIERLTNTALPYETSDLGTQVLKINTTSSPTIDDVRRIEKCLIEHSESSYFSLNESKSTSSCTLLPGQCMHYILISFNEVMESFGIKLQLIEPSVLFCLQPSSRRYNLITRGFDRIKLKGSGNVMTFGISPSEAKILDDIHTRLKIARDGYLILRFPYWVKSDLINGYKSENGDLAAHYFIVRDEFVLHLITIHPKGTYLWSPSFNSSERILKGLLYVNNSAFENFTISPMQLSSASKSELYLPTDARCFLLDMMSSNFLKCKDNLLDEVSVEIPNAGMALKEIKAVLASQMVIFWLWSRSLQGWYEKCNVLHYSPQLNLAIAAKSVEGYNFSALFINSECQHIENHSNLGSIVKIELKYHDVSLNIFLMYEDKKTYWYEYFDGQNTYKLSFPKFTLCSTDVYGLKINVPCETSGILQSEYGQFLKNETLHFNPEMKNVVLETIT